MCTHSSAQVRVQVLIGQRLKKEIKVWLFWICLYYLTAVLSLPVEQIAFINAICSVLGLYFTLSELLMVALLLLLLELFSAICFQLACVRLENTMQFASAEGYASS